MTVFVTRMPVGLAGDISRPDALRVEPIFINVAKAPTVFGGPVKITAGKAEIIEVGDTAVSFQGVLARSVPQQGAQTSELFGSGAPPLNQAADLVREGYVLVKCPVGTPARAGVVFMRVVEALPKKIGDFEATADGVNSVALVGVQWQGDKDANNIAEIFIASR
ncbi:MAG: structural cement protein Gp24 [Burkholderiales bacterium]